MNEVLQLMMKDLGGIRDRACLGIVPGNYLPMIGPIFFSDLTEDLDRIQLALIWGK